MLCPGKSCYIKGDTTASTVAAAFGRKGNTLKGSTDFDLKPKDTIWPWIGLEGGCIGLEGSGIGVA